MQTTYPETVPSRDLRSPRGIYPTTGWAFWPRALRLRAVWDPMTRAEREWTQSECQRERLAKEWP